MLLASLFSIYRCLLDHALAPLTQTKTLYTSITMSSVYFLAMVVCCIYNYISFHISTTQLQTNAQICLVLELIHAARKNRVFLLGFLKLEYLIISLNLTNKLHLSDSALCQVFPVFSRPWIIVLLLYSESPLHFPVQGCSLEEQPANLVLGS